MTRLEMQALHELERGVSSDIGFICGIAGQAMVAIGMADAAVSRMANALREAPPAQRYTIISVLARMHDAGASAAESLARIVEDRRNDDALRGHAAYGLASVVGNNAEGSDRVASIFDAGPENVRQGVLQGMAECGVIPAWAKEKVDMALSAEDEVTRWSAMKAIAGADAESAAFFVGSLFIVAADTQSIAELSACAEALARAQEASIEGLVGIIQSEDVRRLPVVAMALVLLGKHGATVLRRAADVALGECRTVLPLILRDMGKGAVEALLPVVSSWVNDSEYGELADVAVKILGEWGVHATPAIPALVQCVARGEEEVAFLARRVLLGFGALAAQEVERFCKAATPDEGERLRKALGQSPVASARSVEAEFLRFMDMDRTVLRTFVWIADEMAQERMSFRTLQVLLEAKQVAGEIPGDIQLGYRTLDERARAAEQILKESLFAWRPNAKTALLPNGKLVADRVRRFLAWVDSASNRND